MSDYSNSWGLLVLLLLVTALVMANNSMNEASRANERLDNLVIPETDDPEVGEEMLRKISDDDVYNNLRIVNQRITASSFWSDWSSIGNIFFRTYEVNDTDGTSREVGENEVYKADSSYRTDVEHTKKDGTKVVVRGATTYKASTVPQIVSLGKNKASADTLWVEGYRTRFRIAHAQRLNIVSVEIDQVSVQIDGMYSFYLDQRNVGKQLVVKVETRDGVSLSQEYGIKTDTTHLNFSVDSVMPFQDLGIPLLNISPVWDKLLKEDLGSQAPKVSVTKKNSEGVYVECQKSEKFQNGEEYRIEEEHMYDETNGLTSSKKLYGESMASRLPFIITDKAGNVISNLSASSSAPVQLIVPQREYWSTAEVTIGPVSYEVPETGGLDIGETLDLTNGFGITFKSKYKQPLLRYYDPYELNPGYNEPDIERPDLPIEWEGV